MLIPRCKTVTEFQRVLGQKENKSGGNFPFFMETRAWNILNSNFQKKIIIKQKFQHKGICTVINFKRYLVSTHHHLPRWCKHDIKTYLKCGTPSTWKYQHTLNKCNIICFIELHTFMTAKSCGYNFNIQSFLLTIFLNH